MAIRTRAVYPDVAYTLPSGEQIGVVSEEALQDAVAAAVSSAYLLGGIVQVMQDRAQTGVPHEMVTVGALIQWQDRTDAKPQPERAVPAQRVEAPLDVDLEPMRERLEEAAAEPNPLSAFEEPVLQADGSTGWDPQPEELEEQLEREAREEHDDAPLEAVVMGAPVGARVGPASYAQPEVHETPVTHGPQRPPRTEGVGAAALPFQRGGEPGAPAEVNLADIAHGDASSLPRGAAVPAPAGSSEGIDDGFVAESDEDVSSIPENRRD